MIDSVHLRRQLACMKVAKRSPNKRRMAPPSRATLTLNMETYRNIDALRGDATRAAWIQSLVDGEKERRERETFIGNINAAYTPAVCRETLALNDEFPIHEG